MRTFVLFLGCVVVCDGFDFFGFFKPQIKGSAVFEKRPFEELENAIREGAFGHKDVATNTTEKAFRIALVIIDHTNLKILETAQGIQRSLVDLGFDQSNMYATDAADTTSASNIVKHVASVSVVDVVVVVGCQTESDPFMKVLSQVKLPVVVASVSCQNSSVPEEDLSRMCKMW
eukprot:CAMPEP_0113846072 /NCGR_PEP_ID=MMETSP0372-20130328/1103_1 /TAXON_ID=340204 /ORGANISM="Lankesteria abbotti" /LENGTH=173 /DNA_ID=CAMNT_0000815173 /DNA_START=58 /DNA_END=576 /DNA_ORIENTATION=- /assembly_acc=CAM_ASM_000359